MRSFRPLATAAVLLLAMSAAAAESPLDFPNGPAQWLMTAEEKKAWRNVRDAARAQELIDLFFVRRDPTPQTFPNEFRQEFEERVRFADQRFAERNRRGSLTEQGRVLIVLGFPKELGQELSKRSSQYTGSSGLDSMDPTGGRELAGRSVWTYGYEHAIRFGLPKIEVVFIHDGFDGRARRDTQRNDFMSALPAAIRSYIKSPDLTSVPDWAKLQDLQFVPMQPADQEVEAMLHAPLPDAPAEARVSAPADVDAVAPPPAAAPRAASAGRLTLVADAFALEPQSGTDPFAGIAPLEVFRVGEELGWVVEYCSGQLAPLSTLEVTLSLSALIQGEQVNFKAPPEEMVPDSIKASPGCYLVRGGIPLVDMEPANYTLFVTIGRYNLTKDFRLIE